jgi:hypothetical protein
MPYHTADGQTTWPGTRRPTWTASRWTSSSRSPQDCWKLSFYCKKYLPLSWQFWLDFNILILSRYFLFVFFLPVTIAPHSWKITDSSTYISLTASLTSPWQLHLHLPDSSTYISLTAPLTSPWQLHLHLPDSFTYISMTASLTSPWQLHLHLPDNSTYISLTAPLTSPW